MKSPIDVIVDRVLQAAEDSNFTAPLPEDAGNFKKEVALILLHEILPDGFRGAHETHESQS